MHNSLAFDNFIGATTMEFYIEKHSSTPIAKQIEEQIKLAVLMGAIRSGDTLPSIRDIERQTGIHRLQIHKAYMALRRSGLLVLHRGRGKGTVVGSSANSQHRINEKCNKLFREMISRARQSGISPIAFARYTSLHAQAHERMAPFICFIALDEEIAEQTAEEISRLWQVPVIGLAIDNIKTIVDTKTKPRRILTSHIMYDNVKSMLSDRQIAVIPVEIRYTDQTIKKLSRILSNTSVQFIHPPQPSYRMRFIMAQLQKHMKSPGIKIYSKTIRPGSNFKYSLKNARFDYILVGPALRSRVPKEIINNPRIIVLNVQIVPESLEAARIRAGVVI
jgi:GntR family transcriptional regulator